VGYIIVGELVDDMISWRDCTCYVKSFSPLN